MGIYIIRNFGAEGKGFIALITAGVALLVSFFNFGMNNASVYYNEKMAINFKKILKVYICLNIISILIVFFSIYYLKDYVWSIFFKELDFNFFLFLYIVFRFLFQFFSY